MESAGMDMGRVKKILIHSPEEVALQIVRAIQKDKHWEYSGFLNAFVGLTWNHSSRCG